MVRDPSRYVTNLKDALAMGAEIVEWRYASFNLLCDLARPHDQRAMRLYSQEPVKCQVWWLQARFSLSRDIARPFDQRVIISHHPAQFGGHRYCVSGDIMFLVAAEKDSKCSPLNPPLHFISKGHGLKAQRIIISITPIMVTQA